MNSFVWITVAMTAIALLWIVVPLARRQRPDGEFVGARQTNLSILRDQFAELDADLLSGLISAERHANARAELERRALEEPAGNTASDQPGRSGKTAAVALGIVIPLAALSMYLWIGEPEGLRGEVASAEQHASPAEVEDMVARLAARLEKKPDDPRGWMMLGRSYYVLQRMPEAVAAFARAAEKIKDDADLYADYADALAMSLGRRIDGKPLQLVNQALKIDPAHPKALAMAGTEAFYRKDYPAALAYWEKLLPLLPPESEMAKSVAGGIAEAREIGGEKTQRKSTALAKPAPGQDAKSAPARSVSGRVTLATGLGAKASPQDTLFVVARAVNGPRIPLAVLRRSVADLPFDFTLDDTSAMSPELKLSGFPEVVVTARISKSGNAISKTGDLQGSSATVKVGARGVAIVIDSVVP